MAEQPSSQRALLGLTERPSAGGMCTGLGRGWAGLLVERPHRACQIGFAWLGLELYYGSQQALQVHGQCR